MPWTHLRWQDIGWVSACSSWLVIADPMAVLITLSHARRTGNASFGTHPALLQAWAAALLYDPASFRLLGLSGYSDMAIGAAEMFG